jgi:hypothetical protein
MDMIMILSKKRLRHNYAVAWIGDVGSRFTTLTIMEHESLLLWGVVG